MGNLVIGFVQVSPTKVSQYNDHWMLLLKASQFFLSPCLSFSELEDAQELLYSFLSDFEAVYQDKSLITPNFHYAMLLNVLLHTMQLCTVHLKNPLHF